MKKLGLIINPIAGIGGRVGLKGSDGASTQQEARTLGAVPLAGEKTSLALENLKIRSGEFEVITYPAEMGADIAVSMGFSVNVIGEIQAGNTTADDTMRAARDLVERSAELILFAGGDGTARDIYSAVGLSIPVLGIPAGVKIHSGVFARNPGAAGEIVLQYLFTRNAETSESEVMDIDEDLYREGMLNSKLFGYLKVPLLKRKLQGTKTAVPAGEKTAKIEIASEVINSMHSDWLHILGPGTTTRGVTQLLGQDKTLLGVDVLKNQQTVLADANENQLIEILEGHSAKIIISPIGGQGFLFGRGNQQLSPAVLRKAGISNISTISIPEKIYSLQGQPLLVDTGDALLDLELCGYTRVITGFGESIVYPVSR